MAVPGKYTTPCGHFRPLHSKFDLPLIISIILVMNAKKSVFIY